MDNHCSNSILEAHEEDILKLANKPHEQESTAIKHTIRQNSITGLLWEIKTQINAKLISLNTKEKLLEAATKIEGAYQQTVDAKFRELKAELDAIKSRFGNMNLESSRGTPARSAAPEGTPPTKRPRHPGPQ